ncbi:hypothetical protein [Roseisolibacter agri]|uniref:Uncharacterized protein n=1 Tax=Roseisolibacter agri TaxID=2014610 RepID=A0AA37V0J3_9BACT|nr:hypothetical protein [Roseisolibacter agri]GLC24610.1 hypothetical protein rosag_11230 [Roseisolibacter agri]
MTRADIDYIVLDALANDLESVEDILRLANHPEIGWADLAGGAVAEFSVLLALPHLMEDGLVQAYVLDADEGHLEELPVGTQPSVSLDECYFGLTPQGRLVHASWEPPTDLA